MYKQGLCIIRQSFISLILILCAAISPVAIAQLLTSTLENGQFACLGSSVTFTCVTRGSGGISWTSDAYIGPNGAQLVFEAEFDDPDDIRVSASNMNTVATLTREQEDQGVTVLESTLSINPLPNPQTAFVTCVHIDSGRRNTSTFQVIGKSINAVQNILTACQDCPLLSAVHMHTCQMISTRNLYLLLHRPHCLFESVHVSKCACLYGPYLCTWYYNSDQS